MRKVLSEEVVVEGEEVVGVHAFEMFVYSKLIAKKITGREVALQLATKQKSKSNTFCFVILSYLILSLIISICTEQTNKHLEKNNTVKK